MRALGGRAISRPAPLVRVRPSQQIGALSCHPHRRLIDSLGPSGRPAGADDMRGADGLAGQDPSLVCTENLSSGVVVVKSAKDGV